MTIRLDRVHHTIGRAAEYFSASELEKQTGQPRQAFGTMGLKELVDNALDATETAGVSPEIAIAVSRDDDELCLSVADNGAGLPADVIERILDFETRTSDKLAYRAPTRGLQGNALKTLIGLPTALGGEAPLIIESGGRRHEIRPRINPAGAVEIDHARHDQPTPIGTTVTLTLPAAGQLIDPHRWARAFALLNPHAGISVKSRGFGLDRDVAHGDERDAAEQADFYQALVAFPDAWRKWSPSDPTSPHWYTPATLQTLLYGLPSETLLRDFVRQFAGLTGSAKAKVVLDQFSGRKRLADVREDEAAIRRLLNAMQHAARPVPPKALGLIGETAIRRRFAECFGLAPDRFWYAKALDTESDGAPFAVEVAIAQTERLGGVIHGLNFAPTFSDPFADTWLSAGKIDRGVNISGFLHAAHLVTPDAVPATALVHVVSPGLATLDRGKSRVAAGPRLTSALGDALWTAAKTLYEEGERRNKDAAKQERRDQAQRQAAAKAERARHATLIDAVFAVMEQAWARATGDGRQPASARTLYYQARPLVQTYTDDELTDSYFTQTLLPKYQSEVRQLPNVYYEPRGALYEPHTGTVVPLGTREVEDYRIPEWSYNKILFVEKKGLWPPLEAARLGERFDMAIAAGEGFATEAARRLLARADHEHAMQLFVIHDADPSGYNIARTLAAETARMPEHHASVIDLGLRLEDGLAMGLGTEQFTRRKQLPRRVAAKLTERERASFVGKRVVAPNGKVSWVCERIELNAMTSPQLIQFIEDGLAHHNAAAKVVPPTAYMQGIVGGDAATALETMARREIARRLDLDGRVRQFLAGETARRLLDEATAGVTDERVRLWLATDHQEWWKAKAGTMAERQIQQAEPEIIAAIERMLATTNPL
jgi:DNA topoisomerase VI subunit B